MPPRDLEQPRACARRHVQAPVRCIPAGCVQVHQPQVCIFEDVGQREVIVQGALWCRHGQRGLQQRLAMCAHPGYQPAHVTDAAALRRFPCTCQARVALQAVIICCGLMAAIKAAAAAEAAGACAAERQPLPCCLQLPHICMRLTKEQAVRLLLKARAGCLACAGVAVAFDVAIKASHGQHRLA